MSNTTMRPSGAKHSLIIRMDSRGRGSYHAAVPLLRTPAAAVWRTACGEDIIPTAVLSDDAARIILDAPDAPLCKRCERVGNAQ